MSDEKQTVILIDFSALFRRAWHVQSEVSHAYEATIGGVNRAAAMVPDSLVAVCCDGRGNWRKELSKEYKANRESQSPQLYTEMDRTIDRLKKDGRLVWKFDGFEADDVIASAVMRAKTRGHMCRVVSHDKDLLQLLGPSCDFVAIHKTPWEAATSDIVREKYGVDPEQFGDWLALVGDTSDNVKGCPGVGAEKATELLSKHGTIDEIKAQLLLKCHECNATGKIPGQREGTEIKCKNCGGTGDDPAFTPNLRKNLAAFLATDGGFELSRKLVSLSTDVPMKFDEIYETRGIDANEGDKMSEIEADAERCFGSDAPKKEKGEVTVHGSKDPGPDSSALVTGETPTVAAENPIPRESGNAPSASVVEPKKELARVVSDSGAPTDLTSGLSGPTAEIATVQVEYSRQLEPRSLKEASIYADLMFYSKVYSRYPTKQSILAAIVRGREMGYDAGASLDIFHVADFNRDGQLRLMMHAHLIIDRVMRDPGIEYFYLEDGSDDKQATYVAKVKRNPKEQRFTYTIEEATQAGLVRLTQNGKPNNWMKFPGPQLRKTSGVQFGRIVAPGATMGLYCFEEMGIDE